MGPFAVNYNQLVAGGDGDGEHQAGAVRAQTDDEHADEVLHTRAAETRVAAQPCCS